MKHLNNSEFRVYVEDTDYGGVMYHANYLRFCERGRSEWLHDIGFGGDKWNALKLGFAIRHAKLDYLLPARLGDKLRISTYLKSFRKTAVTFYQTITNIQADQMLCSAEIVVVMVNEKFKPCAIPSVLSQHFQ